MTAGPEVEANADGFPRCIGWWCGLLSTFGLSSWSSWDGLEMTGAIWATSLTTEVEAALDVDGAPPPTGIGGSASNGSVSRMIVLNANLTASFSALARIAASVPYVLSGGLTGIDPAFSSTVLTTFS